MRKSFFAISPFCLALLMASYSSIVAEAALIYQNEVAVDPELDFLAESSGFFGSSKKKKAAKKEESSSGGEEKKDETKSEEGGEEKKEEGGDGEEKKEIKNPFVKL